MKTSPQRRPENEKFANPSARGLIDAEQGAETTSLGIALGKPLQDVMVRPESLENDPLYRGSKNIEAF
ncbi:hypothetical protein ABH19_07810 [Leptospirillum sp. Group II 'CF-1']|nr:hypothetical protein ABH19_07810 [Leptospirillum sp. Group II 'CF-1']